MADQRDRKSLKSGQRQGRRCPSGNGAADSRRRWVTWFKSELEPGVAFGVDRCLRGRLTEMPPRRISLLQRVPSRCRLPPVASNDALGAVRSLSEINSTHAEIGRFANPTSRGPTLSTDRHPKDRREPSSRKAVGRNARRRRCSQLWYRSNPWARASSNLTLVRSVPFFGKQRLIWRCHCATLSGMRRSS